MIAAKPEWSGQTVVCIASGPSLTQSDCEIVRAAGHPVVVTNTTYQMCPWADVLFGFDLKWWKRYQESVRATFRGRLFSASPLAPNYGIETTFGVPWFRGFRNSGACAASLGIAGRATKIVLLGYDLMMWDGRRHWHGDHPAGLENASSIADWARQFDALAKYADGNGVEVINASRRTRLSAFPLHDLESTL